MRSKKGILGAALLASFSSLALGSDFYIYPSGEIEGLILGKDAEVKRPLLDARAIGMFSNDAQGKLVTAFTNSLLAAYPDSIVHTAQVREAFKGKYKYQANGGNCGEGFVVPVSRSFAMIAGVTRASYYQIDKGETVEILVPVTLNVQVVKAERGKVAYTASTTQYNPFVFAKKELQSSATKELMAKTLLENTTRQLIELVGQVKGSFNPKSTPVKIVAKAQEYWVADKGFDVGFVIGDELEASEVGIDGEPLLFKVISVDAKYTVLKSMLGKPKVGKDYQFIFSGGAEDGRKPKLLPVYGTATGSQWSATVADLFAKSIGFEAPFLISPVDANFADTMNSIKRQARCVSWDKYPSSTSVFDSRTDEPEFYLRFELGQSPVFIQQGKAAVKSEESFGTVIGAQVVDRGGNVIFSEIGKDIYRIERTGTQGLSLSNAREISTKNAVLDLAKRFVQNVKFENKEYAIAEGKAGEFLVKGLAVPEGQEITYEVLHPLGAKVNGVNVFIRLATEPAVKPPQARGGGTAFSYTNVSPDYPPVAGGDLFRVITSTKPSLPELAYCGSNFVGKDSIPADFLTPIISNAAYLASNYKAVISQPDFYESANNLLRAGFYKFQLKKPQTADYCFKPGYIVKMTDRVCSSDSCEGKVITGIRLTIEKREEGGKDFSVGESTLVKGFNSGQEASLAGYRSTLSVLNLVPELVKRLNSGK